MSQIGFQRNNDVVELSRREVDALMRIERSYLGHDWWLDVKLLHDYDFNAANQRIAEAWEGLDEPSWVWDYGYDDLGQLTSADRKWGDIWNGFTDPVKGQEYSYKFDDIGNRTKVTVNQREITYDDGTSGLNQYAERNVPDAVDILGLAIYPDTDILVNNEPPDEKEDEYFYHVLNFNNSSDDRYEKVTVEEKDDGQTVDTTSGFYFLASHPEKFDYDEDGNLLFDGRWEYTWDAENRLIRAEEIRTQGLTDVNLILLC